MMLVIDLEATCDDGDGFQPDYMEIIEIGAACATEEGIVLDTFQVLVRPVVRPQLTEFCRQLTGIQQADIDAAEPFPFAAAALASFAQRHLVSGDTGGSWGQYDFKQLARDCERHGIPDPLAAFQHVNLKRRFAKSRKIKEVGMAKALQMVGLSLDGAHHRGLDDALNIATLLPYL
jgi:inhibitor of KinA sporulation pathway (predicted exonuclease)